MTDHAVLVPSPVGPVGAVVSRPEGQTKAALILLQGDGRPGRSGVNSVWARLARRLAERGLAVMRFDYAGEGDGTMISKSAMPELSAPGLRNRGLLDLVLLGEAARWLRERTGLRELLLVGDCYGGRVAIEFAATDADVTGAFLAVPYLRELWVAPEQRRRPLERAERAGFHANMLTTVPAMLERGPVWMLSGEHDGDEALHLKRLLGPRGRALEIEVVPGMAIHPVASKPVQDEVTRRVVRRVTEAVR